MLEHAGPGVEIGALTPTMRGWWGELYHYSAARASGATTAEIYESVEIGKMVREKTKENMEVLIKKLTESNSDFACLCPAFSL